MDCRLAFVKDREGGGVEDRGGVSEREEETDRETETDRYRQAGRHKGGVLDCRLPFVKEGGGAEGGSELEGGRDGQRDRQIQTDRQTENFLVTDSNPSSPKLVFVFKRRQLLLI